MKHILTNFKNKAIDILGLDRVSKAYHILIVNYIFLIFYTTLESVFVNTLLYRISDNGLISVIIYRAITYMASAVSFYIGAAVSQGKNPLTTLRLGAFSYLLMYVFLFFGIDYMNELKYIIAIFSGAGGGLYWSGHNILVSNYTNKSNRDVGVSILGIFQGILTLTIPVISGYVISIMPEISGYRVMFGLAMLAVVAQVFVTFKFHPIKHVVQHSKIRLAFKLMTRNVIYKYMIGYDFVRGIRDGTFAFILNMLLFEIITNESVVGLNTFFSGVMAIVGSWAYGKLVSPSTRVKYSLLSITALILSCSVLFLATNITTVIIFNVINAFSQLIFLNSYGNTTFDILGQNQTSRKCMSELFAFRETSIMLGRLLGLFFTIMVPAGNFGYILVILILTLSQYLAVFLMNKAITTLDRKKQSQLRFAD